jgi:undecaprenol kinase
MENQSLAQRLSYAAGGIVTAFRTEAGFRIQLLLAVAGAAVLAAELLNIALEHLADRLHPEQHPIIRAAKDCAAGAVLAASLAAVLIGILTLAVGLHLLNTA